MPEVCIFCLTGFDHEETEMCAEEIQAASFQGLGRPVADRETLKDPISTGRKEAATKAPIGGQCEWAGLKYAGGGVIPIVGCGGRNATDRHHGPDKATLNNSRPDDSEQYNLHVICSYCHNEWHAKNDEFYTEPRPEKNMEWLPNVEFKYHDSETLATGAEILAVESKRIIVMDKTMERKRKRAENAENRDSNEN